MALIQTITGTDSIAVPPNSGQNIFLAATNALITGNVSAHTLTFTVLNGIQSWQRINASVLLQPNIGYFCVGGSVLNLTLPVISAFGDEISISLNGSAGFNILQYSTQRIRYGDRESTLGISGGLTTLNQGDSVRLVCSVANTRWNVIGGSIGNLTVN